MKKNLIIAVLLSAAGFTMFCQPTKLYSYFVQVFTTGIEVDESVNADGSGLKHARGNFTCASNNSQCAVQLNWPGTAFANTNYTAVCWTNSPGFVASNGGKATNSITIDLTRIQQFLTIVDVDCIAMHD